MIFTALAGVLMAIRTTFDPAAGPIRLIFAFEAVIIGGLGSLWGTLLGGMVLGIAQAIGAALSPTWQILAGHIAFLDHPDRPSKRLLPADEGLMTAYRVERATRESRAFAVFLVAIVIALATLPYWGDSGTMRLISEMAYYLALAQLWNLLAGYAGLVSVGQQAFVGIGGYTLFYLSSEFGVHPLFALALAAPVCGAHVTADGAVGVSVARRLFCGRHLGAGGDAAAVASA